MSRNVDLTGGEAFTALLKKAGEVAKKTKEDVPLSLLIKKVSEFLDINHDDETMKQVLAWHVSNLEMPCAARVGDLSAKHYDLDVKGALSGTHEILRPGYSAMIQALADGLKIKEGCVVREIQYDVPVQSPNTDIPVGNAITPKKEAADGGEATAAAAAHLGNNEDEITPAPDNSTPRRKSTNRGRSRSDVTRKSSGVRVITQDGKEFVAEHCIVTLPLGVLKTGEVQFSPRLPDWKQEVIEGIGFGLLNKVALRFDTIFWDDVAGRERMQEEEPASMVRQRSRTMSPAYRRNMANSIYSYLWCDAPVRLFSSLSQQDNLQTRLSVCQTPTSSRKQLRSCAACSQRRNVRNYSPIP